MEGRGEDGSVLGRHEATGIRPKFLDTAADHGIALSPELFRPNLDLGRV